MVLHRSHFDRLFKKRNPRTTKDLAHMAELQLTRRALKPNILDCAPLLKCFIYKLQELQGLRRSDDETNEEFVVPSVYYEDSQSRELAAAASASRAYCWMAATRDMHGQTSSVRSTMSSRSRGAIDGSLSISINDQRSISSSLFTSNTAKT